MGSDSGATSANPVALTWVGVGSKPEGKSVLPEIPHCAGLQAFGETAVLAQNEATKPGGRARPLSPHLTIYRPQWTSVLSIFHRLTGIVLVAGTLALAWWIIAAAAGSGAWATSQAFWGGWIGRLLLLGWTFCLFYHLCNGIRHLVWDTGAGLTLGAARATGVIVVLAAAGLTVVAWVAGYGYL